jgi:M6 family metalloprotease-like protein
VHPDPSLLFLDRREQIMRQAVSAIALIGAVLAGLVTEAGSSVIGREGDLMMWEGSAGTPLGTVGVYPPLGKGPRGSGVPVAHQVLVILVEFNDRGPVGTGESDWAQAFFGASGSVRDYYNEVSYGALAMTPAAETFGTSGNGVVGWLPIGYDHPNTGSTTGIANQQLTRDALIAADPYVDYSVFDANGNGAIDSSELSLVVIAAGYERSYSDSYSPSVWGHRWSLSIPVGPPVLDGVRVADFFSGGGYMQYGEWHQSGAYDGHMATIGIMAHEMGHDLGLPDLYDTDGGSEGIGEWGLMGSGSWGAASGWPGSSPSHLCAWSKEFLGFLTPTVTSGGTGLAVPAVASNPRVYRIETIDPHQYFLVENRQRVGYDQGLPMTSGGLLIWHVDNSAGSLLLNNVNADETHKRVDVEEAEDGVVGFSELDTQTNRGDQRDLYYSGNNQTFDDSTVPSAILYGGFYSGVSISNVSGPGNPMTFDLSYTEPVDGDGDGYFPPRDCDDTRADVYPGAPGEVPGDGIDTNCNGSDDCFVATASFGSRMEGKIDALRWFRDRYLMKRSLGKAFVDAYYRSGPYLAEAVSGHPLLQRLVRAALLPLVGLASLAP